MGDLNFSVIVPTCDRKDLLRGCLKSLEGQKLAPAEILVVDNRSGDGTGAMVREEFPGVRVVSEERPGVHHARNRGLREARTDLVLFTDDDVVVPPAWTKALVGCFEDSSVAAAGGPTRPLWPSSPPPHVLRSRRLSLCLGILDLGPVRKALDSKTEFLIGCNFACRRSVALEYGGFRGIYPYPGLGACGDDYDLSKRLSRSLKVVYEPQAYVNHQISPHKTRWPYLLHRVFFFAAGAGRLGVRPRLKKRLRELVGLEGLVSLADALGLLYGRYVAGPLEDSPSRRIRKVLWFYSELDQSGGAQRLSLEGCRFFERQGLESPYAVCGPCDPKGLFDGAYHPQLVSLGVNGRDRPPEDAAPPGGGTDVLGDAPLTPPGAAPRGPRRIARGLGKLGSDLGRVFRLRGLIQSLKPDMILTEATASRVVQLYLATLFTRFPYVVQVAGSAFALSSEYEHTKYAWVFRNHLREIRDSVYGYRESVPEDPPRLGLIKRAYNEVFSLLKYLAVRKARRVFVHSNQNRWEVGKLYGREAVVLRGAFPPEIFEYKPRQDIRAKLGLEGRKVVFTLSRFAIHKRVDLCLRAFARLREKVREAVLVVGGRSYGCDNFRVREEDLGGLAERLGLGPDVLFVGHVPEAELWDHYAACDVFVHMDLAHFDIAPYEALALGKKVVWSEEMEVEEGLKGSPRIFAARPTVEALAEKLEEALGACAPEPDVRTLRALPAYTWENYFQGMLAELEAASGRSGDFG